MRTAYAVGLLEADPDSPLGVRLVGIDVFSEPDPYFRKDSAWVVVVEYHAGSYQGAHDGLLQHMAANFPWLAKAFNGRTPFPKTGGAS